MNIFIVVVCVNLLTLVNAQNTYFERLLKILKNRRPRRSGYSNNVEISDPDEVIPILPGFYLEKPKDLSKSLFKNPKAWPDDIYAILNEEEAERNKMKVINENTKIKTSEDEYLLGKIQNAVEDPKRFRTNQKQKSTNFKERNFNSENAPIEPVKKLLGRTFQGINSGMGYKIKQMNKKSEKNTGSNTNKILGEILRKILSGNLNNQAYQKSVQHTYPKPEEKSQSKEELLGNILNAIQNNDLERQSETYLHPSVVIISPTSLDNDDYEEENNAKEETSDEDFDSLNLDTRRRYHDHDIGSSNSSSSFSSTSSSSSDYERNPGNPYTVHKNKYKQNWPYNQNMDGDHMNINPFGPQFGSLGPSGPELFFGRKWWYFNQDDFKPMG